jgi:sporulation protein YlmC with PRC-barrel domain
MEESGQLRLRELSELGRLLASAQGYAVIDAEGQLLGRLDRVRYERHTDRPDEIVIRRGRFWRRELIVPFHSVEAVERATGTVRLGRGP